MSAFKQMVWARRSCHESYLACDYTVKQLKKALLAVDLSEKDKEAIKVWLEILNKSRYLLEHIDNWMNQHLGEK